jgi:tetratricopeptide (TPR) repeat protein
MAHIAPFLKDVALRHKTGHLHFRRDNIQKHLYFQEGNLIFTKTNIPSERLGDVLFRSGKITEDTYRLIPTLIQPDAMLGETLVKRNLVSQKVLYEGLVTQMTSITLALFGYFDADITFRERGRFLEGGLEQKIGLPPLIARGIRDMPFHPAVQEALTGKLPLRDRDDNEELLTAEERKILAFVDGNTDADALAAGGRPEFVWKTLYLFDCLGLVEMPSREKKPEGGELRDRLDEALELQKLLPGLAAHQILGVPSHADEAEVKKAYFKLARKFHPDLFGRILTPEQKSRIGEVFDAITKAYKNMSQKTAESGPGNRSQGGETGVDKDRAKNAEIRYRQGKTLFNRGRFDEAIALLEEAVALKDDKADYYVLLAMAQSKVDAMTKRAEANFLRAAALEPWNPEEHVGLGVLYRQEGLFARAKKEFEKALELDPEHIIARRELRVLANKGDEKKGLKGILTKDLFGSKKNK